MMTANTPASILVVDDTAENLRLLSGLLKEHGFRVRPVPSGALALTAAASDPPDAILLDINMPDMDGYEVCRRLKESDSLADIPVIFLTSLSETADKVKALTLGGVDYVTKPFQFEEVLARVNTHVALRRARLALEENYERLWALEQLRDDLVRMIVHDFRSPLAVLCANLSSVADEADSFNRQAARDVRAAVQAAETIRRMANDLFDITRLEEDKMPLSTAPCDVAQVARNVAIALEGIDQSRTIEVSEKGQTNAVCDQVIVQRVLENMVNNAITHTPAGGRIRISVASVPFGVRVAVADEGPGIPAEARRRIFEKFGTVAGRADRPPQASGLGLAFCRLAIEAHGGTIGVEDANPHGSLFWFALPA